MRRREMRLFYCTTRNVEHTGRKTPRGSEDRDRLEEKE